MKKRVLILGSTGSIGTSALIVARQIPDRMSVVGLAAGTRVEDLEEQAKDFVWPMTHAVSNLKNLDVPFTPERKDWWKLWRQLSPIWY